ncbi:hypothetical protein STRNTR1_1605 [Stenotrophomonas maltophilia]|nr:hypothetical protein STRNTR1_1605 [Stenotrophomonas maltophilia]
MQLARAIKINPLPLMACRGQANGDLPWLTRRLSGPLAQ